MRAKGCLEMGKLTYVFCHGLNGCGEYDEQYQKKPYWGGASGDVVAEWRAQGLDAFAASVSPQGSAWDRACELYAQIAGVRTDYGRAHSEAKGHARFGRDFSGQALIPSWDEGTRLVLIAHSFGGETVRLFSELLAHGSEGERAVTPRRAPAMTASHTAGWSACTDSTHWAISAFFRASSASILHASEGCTTHGEMSGLRPTGSKRRGGEGARSHAEGTSPWSQRILVTRIVTGRPKRSDKTKASRAKR